jgi:hypothetical protein
MTPDKCNDCEDILFCLGYPITICTLKLIACLVKEGIMTDIEARKILEPTCSKASASWSPKPTVVGSIPTGFANVNS